MTTADFKHNYGRIHTGFGSEPDSSELNASGRRRFGFAFTLQTNDPTRTVRVRFAVYSLRMLRDRLWPNYMSLTHRTTDDNLKLSGFVLAGSIPSKHHGMATFDRTGITWSAVKRSPPDSNIEWLVTEVQETTIVNVYKPPPSELYPTSLPSVPAPAIYAGDFNCQHTDWGYKQTTKDGETLSDWASSAEAVLLYDPKEPPSFFSARWNTYTNPDLAFAVGRSCDPC